MRTKEEMPDLKELRLFDSCITLGQIVHSGDICPTRGPFNRSGYPQYLTHDNILQMMDRYHISEALVHEHHARAAYPRENGNKCLLEGIKDMARLHPVWVIEPPKQPGRKAAQALVDNMLNAGVKVARLPMKIAPPLPWIWNDLCDVLQDHRIPCMLDFGDTATIGSPDDMDINCIYDIAVTHPKLPLIFS